uniref:ATP phosphoribosyltransferase n=1 Tax=Ascaris lumbricoides TaxID=6252 RepID=A0A0M3HGF1_ASCLU
MNLQIGRIRSQSQLRNDILQTISSFRMQEIYISITPEMEIIANGLIEVGFIIELYQYASYRYHINLSFGVNITLCRSLFQLYRILFYLYIQWLNLGAIHRRT